MVNFAELKAKAEKAKDAGVTKVANTRDRFSSTPTSKSNWDPNWKRGAPPPPPSRVPGSSESSSNSSGAPAVPLRSRPGAASGIPPTISSASRPTLEDVTAPSPYSPPPPPTRSQSGYPPGQSIQRRDASMPSADKIDWTNLSPEDKEVFFGWLDEFFSRYLSIELGPRTPRGGPVLSTTSSASSAALPVRGMQYAKLPPLVNKQTRPQA